MLINLAKSPKWKIYGNSSPEVLIAGHSHTFAPLMAILKNPEYAKYFGVVAEARSKNLGKGTIRDQSYWDFVVKNSHLKNILISWNGNQHNIHFLLDELKPFQIFGFFEESKDAPVVPISQLSELFSPTFQELKATLNLFPKTSNVVLLGTPPPKSKSFIDSILASDKYFFQKATSLGIKSSQIKATSDILRIAMWQFTQDKTAEVASDLGLKFIPNPNSAVEKRGLLRSEFWSDDITHANEKFGELLLSELLNYLGILND